MSRFNYGVGFDQKFKPAADWRTYSLAFRNDESDRPWFFAGQAHLRAYDKLQKRFAQIGGAGNVLPRLCLPTNAKDEIEGTVADIEIDGRRNVFQVTLRRVSPEHARSITNIEAMLRLDTAEVQKIFQQPDTFLDSTDPDAGADTALPH
jgi:hypothetical protein